MALCTIFINGGPPSRTKSKIMNVVSTAPIGIIVAMHEELAVVLSELQHAETIERAGLQLHRGQYHGKDVIAVICGVGKVHAALCTQLLISEFAVRQVINLGIAGGIGPGIQPGDVVIADTLVQHDMDVTPLGLKPGQIFRLDTFDFSCDPALLDAAQHAAQQLASHRSYVGRIVSGDQFIADPAKSRWLHEEFDALACEMESASIAQVCYLNHVPFVCIRSISDNANEGAHMDFDEFMPIAVANASTLLQHLVPAC